MNPGALRHRVNVQVRTRTPDGQGGYTETWADVPCGAVFASIEPASGREVYAAQQRALVVTHRVTVRYLAGLTGAHRVLFGNRMFDIRSILNPDERNRQLVLLCEEGTPS